LSTTSFGKGIFLAGTATGKGIQPTSGILRIVPVGVDKRMRHALALFFKTKLNGQFVFAGAGEGDIRIIDLDSYTGRTLWTHRPDHQSSLPTILLSIVEVETDANTRYVRKPIQLESLEQALTDMASTRRGRPQVMQLQDGEKPFHAPDHPAAQTGAMVRSLPESVPPMQDGGNGRVRPPFSGSAGFKLEALNPQSFLGSASDIDPSDPQQVAKALFDPEDYLIGKFVKAKALCKSSQRVIRMVTDRGAITLIPASDQVVVDIQPKSLRTLGSVPVFEGDVRLHFLKDFSLRDVPEHKIWRLESLQWMLTLLASRGRVPVGTDLKSRVALCRWPNLTRLPSCPSGVRITALLSSEPMPLIEVARTLKVPQRNVFAFYAAAQSLGLTEKQDLSSVEAPQLDAFRPPKRRRLFEMILSHLRR